MQLFIEGDPVHLEQREQHLICADSTLDLTEAQVSLEWKGYACVQIVTEAGNLEITAQSNQCLSDFYNSIRKYGIQTNYFERFSLKFDKIVQENLTGVEYKVIFLEQVPQNLEKIKKLRQLPKQFERVQQVYEELDHYYLIYDNIDQHQLTKDNAFVTLFQCVFALQKLEKMGYSHTQLSHQSLLRKNEDLILGDLYNFQQSTLKTIIKDIEDLKEIFKEYLNPDLLAVLDQNDYNLIVYSPYFHDLIGQETVMRIVGSDIQKIRNAQEYYENNIAQIQSFQSIHSSICDSPLNSFHDAICSYKKLSTKHIHNLSSKQFFLDQLFNQNLLNEQQYVFYQDQEDSLTELGYILQKEIDDQCQSPFESNNDEGSTCPNTVKITKQNAKEKLFSIMQQAKQMESDQQKKITQTSLINKSKIQSVRKSLMDFS